MFRSRTYWSISGASSNARYAYSSLVIHHCNILYFLILSYYMYIHTIAHYRPYIHTLSYHTYNCSLLSFIHTVPYLIVHTYSTSYYRTYIQLLIIVHTYSTSYHRTYYTYIHTILQVDIISEYLRVTKDGHARTGAAT